MGGGGLAKELWLSRIIESPVFKDKETRLGLCCRFGLPLLGVVFALQHAFGASMQPRSWNIADTFSLGVAVARPLQHTSTTKFRC